MCVCMCMCAVVSQAQPRRKRDSEARLLNTHALAHTTQPRLLNTYACTSNTQTDRNVRDRSRAHSSSTLIESIGGCGPPLTTCALLTSLVMHPQMRTWRSGMVPRRRGGCRHEQRRMAPTAARVEVHRRARPALRRVSPREASTAWWPPSVVAPGPKTGRNDASAQCLWVERSIPSEDAVPGRAAVCGSR